MTTRTVNFRADDEVDAALRRLQSITKAGSISDVIRRAVLDADKAAQRAELRRWAEEQLADPEQVAETMRVNAYMESIRAR